MTPAAKFGSKAVGPCRFGLAPAAGILVAGDADGALRLFELPGLTIRPRGEEPTPARSQPWPWPRTGDGWPPSAAIIA